tara:strand:- start:440 stop:646 length:207 start_codon:yes stop_codon:yes gene_type:complete
MFGAGFTMTSGILLLVATLVTYTVRSFKMKLAILLVAIAVGGFFTAKLSLEFLDLLIEKLKEDNNHRD